MVTIYALTCMENGKAYIGCTAGKIAKRFREHKCNLNMGRHTEPLLMEDWKLYGAEKFSMEVVFELEDDANVHTKRAMEKFAMARYKSLGLLYNLNEASFAPTPEAIAKGQPLSLLVRGKKYSPETIQKRRLAQLGKPKNHGAKISATKKLLGQRPSVETARLGGIAACKKRYEKE